jgi:hypothetical protein
MPVGMPGHNPGYSASSPKDAETIYQEAEDTTLAHH